jgi:uridine kinase
MKPVLTLGITGGSGSGKTYFLTGLAARFSKEECCLISLDNYYKPRDQQPVDANGMRNFDLPESIERAAFFRDVLRLKEGEVVTRTEYTYNNPKATPRELTFRPAPLLIVEGLFIQHFTEVDALLDLRIFIEAKDHVKLGRRIRRDQVERGYDLDDVLYRYEHHVMPVYETLIAPLKHSADIVIPNHGHIDRALDVLAAYLRSKLAAVAN